MAAGAVPGFGQDELRRDLGADADAKRAAVGEPAAFGWVDGGRRDTLADLDALVFRLGRVGNRVDQQLRVRMQGLCSTRSAGPCSTI